MRNAFNSVIKASLVLAGMMTSHQALAADPTSTPAAADIGKTYADIAEAMYGDSLSSAANLQKAVEKLIQNPSTTSLSAARAAWIDARKPYQQTEVFRFGNATVDDWEGKVNAWPLDEGLIDYVDASDGTESDNNPAYMLNVIANTELTIGSRTLDTTNITPALLAEELHEAQEVESNVATGYHAIEFLLWGQDLNGTGAGAGNRPATDFDTKNCTNGNCDRRAAYLKAATDLLISDLKEMHGNWIAGGAARQNIESLSDKEVLKTILTGLGSLSYGELAGERMKLGVMLHDPEEEHDCFSDNTHNSHYYNQVGMTAIFNGSYTRLDGQKVEGASLAKLAKSVSGDIAGDIARLMDETSAKMQVMKDRADNGVESYDQMLAEGNATGNKILLDVVDGLVAQTRGFEKLVSAFDLNIDVEGSDSLDNPQLVN